jgi:hypothetical protein
MQLVPIGPRQRLRTHFRSALALGYVTALSLTLVACQGSPPARPVTKTSAALAVEALDKGDYAKAADLYRDALAGEPESVPVHYGLGVASSYLDRKADAIREFTWVVNRAAGNSPEAMTARRWLESAGALRRPANATREGQEKPEEPTVASSREEERPAPAVVKGRVVFDEIPGVIAPQKRMMLLLSDYPKREVYLRLRTDSDGQFRFADVPPGVYKLTDRVAGPPRWRLRLELKPGQEMTLDLDPANSIRVRDDFPEPPKAAEPPSS